MSQTTHIIYGHSYLHHDNLSFTQMSLKEGNPLCFLKLLEVAIDYLRYQAHKALKMESVETIFPLQIFQDKLFVLCFIVN